MTSLLSGAAAMAGSGLSVRFAVAFGAHRPGSAAAMLAVAAVGALWTAVELPVAPARPPPRRLTAAVCGVMIILLAPLLLAALLAGLVPAPFVAAGRIARGPALPVLLALAAASGAAVAGGVYLLIRLGLFKRAILVLGGAPDWAEAGATLDPGRGRLFRIADVVPADRPSPLMLEALRRRRIWAVVLAGAAGGADPELSQRCNRLGVRVLAEEEFRERWLGRVDLARLGSCAIGGSIAAPPSGWRGPAAAIVRRGADLALALALLLFTLPLTLLVALLVRLESPGPVLYRQERVGLNGRPFQLIKFRSMRVDAEAGLDPQWARPADPRVTRIGGVLRLTRIDELPQLWNVLRGQMSVIGPRPERPFFVERLAASIPGYHQRAQVKPGITGWAQVNYRYGASIDDARVKLAYDLYYVKHRSLLLDLAILAATVRVVLFQEGAR